ncbi:MAG: hypothetical protein KKC75_05790 [Nanoarchaeota archaeon]|nr:hypothetical protein [Nanoarchaeota archaeon]MBU1004912.1 hypothetical protein [Nanoarchaeota archaeon]MBU1945642.1 hypothetical protein [Nanoarchaeota archaeon]
MKKRLTPSEEFEIMKMVLDKFLWLGVAIMGYGLYRIFVGTSMTGFSMIIIGAIILVLFLILIVKEYEIVD